MRIYENIYTVKVHWDTNATKSNGQEEKHLGAKVIEQSIEHFLCTQQTLIKSPASHLVP